ncbi:MAG: hypothetical protein ACXWAT_16755, partial [Methylobacter sp.]
ADLVWAERQAFKQCAMNTAEEFSMSRSTASALACYEALRARALADHTAEDEQWEHVLHLIEAEWDILKGLTGAAVAALGGSEGQDRGNI